MPDSDGEEKVVSCVDVLSWLVSFILTKKNLEGVYGSSKAELWLGIVNVALAALFVEVCVGSLILLEDCVFEVEIGTHDFVDSDV